MNRLLFIFIFSLVPFFNCRIYAQFHSVNYDRRTVAAMAAAFGSELAAESFYEDKVAEILKHYTASEVATAGIFASKFFDRKALTNIDIWSSTTENYYYRRIYHMVSEKIIPKIWVVSGMMLHSPQTAVYWGSYLMKICKEVKFLCMQFESIVTNGTLSFSDIMFLEFKPEVCALFNLSELGNVDWEGLWGSLSSVSGNFSVEHLKSDADNLYRLGVGLAFSGMTGIGDVLMSQSSFNGVIHGKVRVIKDFYDDHHQMFDHFENNVTDGLKDFLSGSQNVSALYQPSDYDFSAWKTSYLNNIKGSYYTQRWYIAKRNKGEVPVCDYYPPVDDRSILKGKEWIRIRTKDENFYPDRQQREVILKNSERYAGWSREKVKQLNYSDDSYLYLIEYFIKGYHINRKGRLYEKAYAFEIHVTKSWDRTEIVHEEIFDSYSMDFNSFKSQLDLRLAELNEDETGNTYFLQSDPPEYYQTTDALKLKGCETVTISVTKTDGASLGNGTTKYKCRKCGKSLNSHSLECTMKTTVVENELDISPLEQAKTEADNKVSSLRFDLSRLEEENRLLMQQIPGSGEEEAEKLRHEYAQNQNMMKTLTSDLHSWERKQAQLEEAIFESKSDNDIATDDYYRIPAIMQDCSSAYGLSWQDKGHWEGYTFIRRAQMANIKGSVSFRATLKIVRKPKYLVGILIHRAIMQISWELTSSYTDTHVAEVLTLSPGMSDDEKVKYVNRHISDIARQNPGCKITTEYARSEPVPDDQSADVIHLLWASDRLQVAREVDSRITKIYSDLVSLEKMMHYKRSIVDVLNEFFPPFDYDQGRRLTLVQECHKRWFLNAKERSRK